MALTGTGCSRAKSRPLLSSDHHPADYPTVRAVDYMAQILREETDGRLDIRIYAGGQLGSERDTLEITTFGGLDLNRVNFAPLNAIEPMTVVPSLPFLFRSQAHLHRVLDGEEGEQILASLEKHNLIGLCYYDSGARSFYNTQKPIRTPEDMEGMKIRVPSSDLYVAMIRGLGADATPMSLSEVYQSLVQGVIDGAENNYPSYDSSGHFEAAKYYSVTQHLILPECLCINKALHDGLSDEDKKTVQEAADASVAVQRAAWAARAEQSKEKVIAAGIEVNEVADKQAFQDAMQPVYDNFIKANPDLADLVKAIQDAQK